MFHTSAFDQLDTVLPVLGGDLGRSRSEERHHSPSAPPSAAQSPTQPANFATAAEGDLGRLGFMHLQAELARVDLLIQRQVQRFQAAGRENSDAFRGLRITEDDANGFARMPIGGHWGQLAQVDREAESQWRRTYAQAEARSQEIARRLTQAESTPPLHFVASVFGLSQFEYDALLIALAPTFDLRFEKLYGYLQDDVTRKQAGVNLVLDLLTENAVDRWQLLACFMDEAPLIRHALVVRNGEVNGSAAHLLAQSLTPDHTLAAWLLGAYQPRPELGRTVSLDWYDSGTGDTSLAADEVMTEEIWPALSNAVHGQTILVFRGDDQETQRAIARLIAHGMQRYLLTVKIDVVIQAGVLPLQALEMALRDARLTGAVVHLQGWDACLKDGLAPVDILKELCDYPDLIILSGKAEWYPAGAERDRPFLWLEVPTPKYTQRQRVWRYFLGDEAEAHAVDLDMVAGYFKLTTAQIRDAVSTAVDWAYQRGEAVSKDDLFAAARSHSTSKLSEMARKVTPRHTWDDLVLPQDQITTLNEIVDTVRSRPKVLEEWGVGKKLASSAAVTVLFSGEPGTGKTIGAQVLAKELGLDLYKIDLSGVVSKYIGETEKNLERIFEEAERSNAILFFDEADSIFGKRSEVKDARDRYANIEVSYLLQRMEAYDGVTILATNLRANLDDAFTRRLQFAIDFPFPDDHYRLRLWETLFPPDVPRDPDLDLDYMARRFRIAGGNIRNIIVNAAFLAAAEDVPVHMRHLLHGTRRELQKTGRLINEEDLRV